MSRVKWYDNTYTFQLYQKGTFTYCDSNPRDSRNQEMWRWCSQIASDYIEFPFNPLRLVSAPPPPPVPPLVLRVASYRHPRWSSTWYTGVSQNNFLWQKLLALQHLTSLFQSPFLSCLTPVHFMQHPLPKKCTPFFLPIINPRTLFPLSSSSRFLSFLNKCANYSYRRILKPPC